MAPAPPLVTDDDVSTAVRALYHDPSLHVLTWHAEDVGWRVVSDVTDTVYRVRGVARHREQSLPWSLVVKTLRPGADGHAHDHEGWVREYRAYSSGLLRPAEGVRPARLLQVTRPSPDRLLLWLEDVPDDTPEVWPLERHVQLAAHLGHFNAAHPVGPSPPPWLWHDWLDSMNPAHHSAATALALQQEVWDAPLVRLAFGTSPAEALVRVNGAFQRWTSALMALPRTLVHLDAGRFNVRATVVGGRQHSVLLDWQALGVGAVGTDLAMTHFLNVCRFYADPDDVAGLDAQGFEAYWTSVMAAGLEVRRRDVRFAYTAVAAMRASIVIQLLLARLVEPTIDLRLWGEWGRKREWSEREALRAWGTGMTMLLALGEEADDLASPR